MATVDLTRIAGNIQALNALNSLQHINTELTTHQARLATGKRINESSDDPAGLSIATTFQIRSEGLQTALKVIGDAKNLLSISETNLTKIQELLIKMRNKALEAQSGTIGPEERQAIQDTLVSYRDEINDIAQQALWNKNFLLVGASGSTGTTAPLNFLTGPDISSSGSATMMPFQFNAITGGINNNQGFYASSGSVADATGLGLSNPSLDLITDATSRAYAVTAVEAALTIVKQGISQVGAGSARLTFKEEALSAQYTQTEAAYNRIINANMAEEQVAASKFMILQQTSTAMLAQANSAPQFILQLFK
jgi:flagellin